jgi:hypothetical protein
MAETITEDQPRIKFDLKRLGQFSIVKATPQILALIDLQRRLEAEGAVPVLADGAVAGNRAATPSAVGLPSERGAFLLSKSGKPPGVPLAPADFCKVASFDRQSWSADYASAAPDVRPSSDTPLHAAALHPSAPSKFGWTAQPGVAVHGHALAEGAGLTLARSLGMPISEQETLFSTPEDLEQLEALFARHPYPEHRCYIRRGHGFFLLAEGPEEAATLFERLILRHLHGPVGCRESSALRDECGRT